MGDDGCIVDFVGLVIVGVFVLILVLGLLGVILLVLFLVIGGFMVFC